MLSRIAAGVLCALLLCSARVAAQSGADGFTYTEITAVAGALTTSHWELLPIAPDRMPAYDPIAHYVHEPETRPVIWINRDSALWDPKKTPSAAERFALLSAAVLVVTDEGSAGRSMHDLYVAAARSDAALPPGVSDRYRERHAFANAIARQIPDQELAVTPVVRPLAVNPARLLSAVSVLLRPGNTDVTTVTVPAARMPAADPIAHYAGRGPRGIGRIEVSSAARIDSRLHPSAAVLEAYLSAFVLAACDLGKAGPDWKKRYLEAAAADAALPPEVPDRFTNRHELAAPVAAALRGLLQR